MKGDQAPRWRRVFGAIRDGWLMVGMTFCLLLLVVPIMWFQRVESREQDAHA